ncbi:MAG: hypothetical protein OEX77_03310 [Candidatus Bathyarchaeota archaeon]|nr:hypothetical protein [Candidatus Bathyarchaeota archaeon]MDH5733396.1 hypothetical protein [Candidatus Bathyarchaeota archaeon]
MLFSLYVRLKKKEILLLKEAAMFMLRHKKRSRWNNEQKKDFYKRFVLPSQKGKDLGRPTEHEKGFIEKRGIVRPELSDKGMKE